MASLKGIDIENVDINTLSDEQRFEVVKARAAVQSAARAAKATARATDDADEVDETDETDIETLSDKHKLRARIRELEAKLVTLREEAKDLPIEIVPNTYKNKYISVSRLKLFVQCPKQFKSRYIDKLDSDYGEPAAFGVVMHNALQDLFDWVIREEFSGVLPIERLLEYYRQRWTEAAIDSPEYHAEGLKLCREYLNCHPDVDHFDIMAVEKEFKIKIGQFEFYGFMDRVDRVGNDEIVIIDYKTNRMLYAREDLATDIQASIYLIVAAKLWPWAKKISFRFDMLRHNLSQFTQRTPEEVENARAYAIDTAIKTEHVDQQFPARINNLCGWCSYRSSCDEYDEAVKDGVELIMIDTADLEALSAQRELIAATIKPMDSRKKEIEGILKARLEDAPDGELKIGNYIYRVHHVFKKRYPVDDTSSLLTRYGASEEELAACVVMDKKQVEDLGKKIEKRTDENEAIMFTMELKATADEELSFARFSSKIVDKALAPTKELKRLKAADDAKAPKEWDEDLECVFCQKKPAKMVERSDAKFAVCKEHKRKRKPPKKK